MEELNEEFENLKVGSRCPKCELGKQGLEKTEAFKLGLSGWENYDFLHCPICGAFFVGKDNHWHYLKIRPIGEF